MKKVLKRSALGPSLMGLSKDWTQGENVQSFIELVGEGMC